MKGFNLFSRVFKAHGSNVLACCDKELLGKTVQDGEISIEARKGFYGSRKTSEKQLAGMLQEADNINLLGTKAVGVALKQGLIKEGDIIRIGMVPHVQIYKLPV
ncbi:MAG: hypothetical protein QT03_C0001G1314 [archaeon GW2011_AR10]|nr:MAG: hypothetical protein QT03_C0001G1314 [archaeon GW2011_AR10]